MYSIRKRFYALLYSAWMGNLWYALFHFQPKVTPGVMENMSYKKKKLWLAYYIAIVKANKPNLKGYYLWHEVWDTFFNECDKPPLVYLSDSDWIFFRMFFRDLLKCNYPNDRDARVYINEDYIRCINNAALQGKDIRIEIDGGKK